MMKKNPRKKRKNMMTLRMCKIFKMTLSLKFIQEVSQDQNQVNLAQTKLNYL